MHKGTSKQQTGGMDKLPAEMLKRSLGGGATRIAYGRTDKNACMSGLLTTRVWPKDLPAIHHVTNYNGVECNSMWGPPNHYTTYPCVKSHDKNINKESLNKDRGSRWAIGD